MKKKLHLLITLTLLTYPTIQGGKDKKQKNVSSNNKITFGSTLPIDTSLANVTLPQSSNSSTSNIAKKHFHKPNHHDPLGGYHHPENVNTISEKEKVESIDSKDKEVTEEKVAPAKSRKIIFSRDKVAYTPSEAFVPKQKWVGIGYQGVIDKVEKLPESAELKGADLDTYKSDVTKAIRDLIGYAEPHIKSNNFKSARDYLISMQKLAILSSKRNLLLQEQANNICAWISKYNNALEKQKESTITEFNSNKITLSSSELAIMLGLQHDPEVALEQLKSLDQTVPNKSQFTPAVTDLFNYYLTLQNYNCLEKLEVIIENANKNGIEIPSDEWTKAQKTIEDQKKQNLNQIQTCMKLGIELYKKQKKTQEKLIQFKPLSFKSTLNEAPLDHKTEKAYNTLEEILLKDTTLYDDTWKMEEID